MRRIVALLLVLTGLQSCVWSAAERPAQIVIMHTNDLHGQLLPREGVGGIAEIATIMKEAKPDLIFDAGDLSTGTFLSDEFQGAPTIQAMNLIGYTAAAIGNHEFDYGQDALRLRVREAKFPFLSANLNTPIAEIGKYTIAVVRGIRFGVIGLTTEEVTTKSHPHKVVGVTVLDVVKALEKLLPEVRAKSDFIIAVVHLEDEEEERLVSAFPEIRLIIGGHNHAALGPIWIDKTLVAKTGVAGRNVGRVELQFQGKELTNASAKLIPVRNVPPDAATAKTLEPFNDKVKVQMAEVIGEATEDLTYSRTAESPLANLVADAFRREGMTQIAVHNVGGIRARVVQGKITWGNAFEVLPFQNTLVTLQLTGSQLKKTLERSLVSTVGLAAVSGIRVRLDRNKPAGERVVSMVLLDGSAVQDSKLYSVATNDFVLAGGDGYDEFAKGTGITDTGIFLRDILVQYIRSHRIISPKLDGRIVVN
jgi:2',3'-cyclic-nucleotide 2'-phosphodiesterase (5'-nucleotidase family)